MIGADDLRRRGESLNEDLGREAYRGGAGLSAATDFAGIFERYQDLAGDEAWEAARGVPALAEWAADLRIGRATAALEDRLHAWESGAAVELEGGERIPWHGVGIAIANAEDRGRRLALDRARRRLLGEPTAIRREKLARERDLLDRLTGLGVPEARARLSGIDLDALAGQAGEFLAATADLHREVHAGFLRAELDLAPSAAHRSDAARLFRAARFDAWFPGASLVDVARRQVGEMGIGLEAEGRVVLDTEVRERKRARAFCAPVRVPDEVYLVIRPHGGHSDYGAFWHELGHALHFSHAGRALPFEHRWLGDNSVTEGFAMLFEHQLLAPAWLRRNAGMDRDTLAAFRRAQAYGLLAVVRRYAAKLRYELALHRAPSLDRGAEAYVELLSEATGFRYEPEDALLDLDDGFYAARYLRAWQLESMLRAHLVARFDEDWFRNPRAGPFVLDLMARGQRDDAAALSAEVVGAPLGFAALVRWCEEALG